MHRKNMTITGSTSVKVCFIAIFIMLCPEHQVKTNCLQQNKIEDANNLCLNKKINQTLTYE